MSMRATAISLPSHRACSISSARWPTSDPWFSIPVSASRRLASTSASVCLVRRPWALRKTRYEDDRGNDRGGDGDDDHVPAKVLEGGQDGHRVAPDGSDQVRPSSPWRSGMSSPEHGRRRRCAGCDVRLVRWEEGDVRRSALDRLLEGVGWDLPGSPRPTGRWRRGCGHRASGGRPAGSPPSPSSWRRARSDRSSCPGVGPSGATMSAGTLAVTNADGRGVALDDGVQRGARRDRPSPSRPGQPR